MEESDTMRIVILGKTGAGKSSLANTLFGETTLFTVDHSPNSETSKCQSESRCVNGQSVTLIDTPGFFDTEKSEEDLKSEIVKCITECSPGPHAFLIVLKVERFTKHEQAVISKIQEYFSEEVFKYSTVLFTHGENLDENFKTIKELVIQSNSIKDLVDKCGGRCHVIDNKYWNDKPEEEYRSNKFQVGELMKTIEETLKANNGEHYSNEFLQEVEEKIQQEEKNVRQSCKGISDKEVRKQARARVCMRLLSELVNYTVDALIRLFLGVKVIAVRDFRFSFKQKKKQ